MEVSGELVRAPDGRIWHIAHMPLQMNAVDEKSNTSTHVQCAAGSVNYRVGLFVWVPEHGSIFPETGE